ncbi:reverse transcriptase domain-containing protein [Tanacetum coccineum]
MTRLHRNNLESRNTSAKYVIPITDAKSTDVSNESWSMDVLLEKLGCDGVLVCQWLGSGIDEGDKLQNNSPLTVSLLKVARVPLIQRKDDTVAVLKDVSNESWSVDNLLEKLGCDGVLVCQWLGSGIDEGYKLQNNSPLTVSLLHTFNLLDDEKQNLWKTHTGIKGSINLLLEEADMDKDGKISLSEFRVEACSRGFNWPNEGPPGLDYINYTWAQAQQSNRKTQWTKTKPRPTGYGPETARRTESFHRMLPQDKRKSAKQAQENYLQILPNIAEEKYTMTKVQTVNRVVLYALRALSLRLRKPHVILSQEHPSKEGASRKGSDQDMSAADPEVLTQGVTAPNLLRKMVQKEKQCSKGWKKVCSTGSETRERVYPYTQTTQGVGHTTVAVETLKVATKTLVREQQSLLPRGVIPREHPQEERRSCQKVKAAREVTENPFTPRIHYFDFPKTRIPSHIKTYDGSKDPEDHLMIFQSAAKTERWAMPTWCHMIISTLTGNVRLWFDDLPKETIDSHDDLKKAILENYLQQKKCIKDPVEIHNIRQSDGESTEEFVRRYKLKCRDVKGAPECMKISGFMHGITNPELIKRLHDKIPNFSSWKQQEANQKQNFKKGGYRNQQRSKRKQDRFSLLTKNPKEIFALDKGKFKAPPPMTTPVEKRNHAKFCEFHGEVGHNTDECMHLKKQIEEMLKAGKLKDKALAILMVQPWERVARQRITQNFSINPEIFFPLLGEDERTEGPMIIETEIGGHCVHRMYVDGGSASEILYEHCFNRLCPKIRKQLIPATTPLIGFSGEIIWPIGQIQLLVKIGDEEHSTLAWMNFMVNAKDPGGRRSDYPKE